jgi:hypothetical protein
MKVSIKGFITSKSAEQYIDCADNYAVNKSRHKFSISDGVSKSFFPKIWSDILVCQFIETTNFDEKELIKLCQEEWKKRVDEIVSLPETKWFTKAQYNKKDPALATFVGLQFYEKEKKWSASAIGDSFLFFVPKKFNDYQKDLVKLSSKTEPIIFDNFPDYLTSIGDLHNGRIKEKSGKLKDGTFYLMTDALAEWFLNEGENAIGKISVWQSQSDFEKFIVQAREENQLTNDDSAILCIELTECEKQGIEYKKLKVTDLYDLITEQEAEKEKANQKILKKEKLKKEQEKVAEIQKSKELEILEKESNKSDNLENNEKGEQPNIGVIAKVFKGVKGLLGGKEKSDEPKIVFEQIVNSDEEVFVNPNPQEVPKIEKEVSIPETSLSNEIIDGKEEEVLEELEKVKDVEKTESNEQPKVDSKAKNIFDKF